MHLFLSPLVLLFLTTVPHQGECRPCSTAKQRKEALQGATGFRQDVHVRPDGEGGGGSPVKVKVDFAPTRFINLDSEHYWRPKMFGHLSVAWTDPRLSLTVEDVTSVRVPVSAIWTPDIELFNGLSKVEVLNQQPLAVVYNSGHVRLVYNMALPVICSIDNSRPDFIAQCVLKFGSWTYNSMELDLQVPARVNLAEYVPDRRWNLTSANCERRTKIFSCCQEPYATADFHFTFHRP